MNNEEQAQYLMGSYNASQHYYDKEPECVFCGIFGPTDSHEKCCSREQIGRQVAFLISKLRRIRALASDAGYDRGHDGILAICKERLDWPLDV